MTVSNVASELFCNSVWLMSFYDKCKGRIIKQTYTFTPFYAVV